MITYNETIERIKKVFKENFNIKLDNFSEKTELREFGFYGTITGELNNLLCNEFKIDSIYSIFDTKTTIEEIANEIMESINSDTKDKNYTEENYEEDSDNSILILYVFAAFIIGAFVILMLF